MRAVKIGNKMVGDGHPCYISFEAGATHDGVDTAKKLVKACADAGADSVKFQTVLVDEIMAPEASEMMIDFQTPEGKKKETILGALKRRELNFEQWKEIKLYCDELGIGFVSTPSGETALEWLVELKADAIKVGKSDINNFHLIDCIAKTGLPVILDARERFQDVDRALRICHSHKNYDVVIMHCPSGYPAEFSGIHLKVIPFIKENFQTPVAYSDHSVGDIMCYAAIGLGANFIEKTVTLNKGTHAVEHFMSLEPNELKPFIQRIREVELAMGDTRIVFNSRVQAEVRRSIYTKTPIKTGDVLSLDNITFKRPGTGISVENYLEVLGKKVKRNIEPNKMLKADDFE